MLSGGHYYAFDRPCTMAHATENEPKSQSPKTPDKGQPTSPPAKGPSGSDQPAPVRVKQEPTSEADDHLRKLLEQPKPKSPLQVARPPAPAACLLGGQRTINSYFSQTKAAPTSAKEAKKPEDEEPKAPAIDLESIRGIFGWTTLGGVHIPFILRQEEKFMAVRIIETTLLQKYLKALPKEVYKCTFIKSYFITDNEAKLLNEINMRHCDRQYGAELFTTKDYVVPLSDVEQLYEFLTTCYHKLSRSAVAHRKEARCGILTIEGSAIPYIRRHGTKHVPLLLFDQEIVKQLEMKAEKLEAWEVSYLMFCCKVADIGSEFILENSCLVVSIDDVQQTAGGTVQFEEWWPSAQGDRQAAAAAEFWTTGNGRTEAPAGSKERLMQAQAAPPLTVYFSGQNAHPQHGSDLERGYADPGLSPGGVLPKLPACNGTAEGGVQPNSLLTYPLHPPPNPQQFLYNGQWWGPLSAARPALEGRYCPSLAAHCPEGPTQCSPSAMQLPHSPTGSAMANTARLTHYSQGPGQADPSPTMSHPQLARECPGDGRHSTNASSSDYSQLYGFPKVQAPASQPPAPPVLRSSSTDPAHRNYHGESSPSAVNGGQYYRVLPNAPTSQLKEDSSRLPKVSSVQSLAPGIRNSPYLNGVPASGHSSDLSNGGASSRLVRISDSFLAKHLLNSNGAPRAHHLENYVVAPGNVQAMVGKMSSPKPGNPVPVNVLGDPSHRPTYLLDGLARTASVIPPPAHLEGLASPLLDPHLRSNITSKLQQLLHNSSVGMQAVPQLPHGGPAGESPWTQKLHSSVPKYKIQPVLLAGSRFRAINASEYQHTSDLMVPLVELAMNLKTRVSTPLCKHVLSNVLSVPLYRANPGQEEVIKSKLGNCETTLVRAVDVHRYLPQLLYSVASLHLQQGDKDSQPTAKRARVENAVNS